MRYLFGLVCCCLISTLLQADLSSHRAHYSIKLKYVDPGNDIKNVYGKMIFELKKVDDGWTIEQTSITTLVLKNGEEDTQAAQYKAWESHDGKELKFTSFKQMNQEWSEVVKGQASFTETGGSVTFYAPEIQHINFQHTVLPPVSHLRSLVHAAQEQKLSLHHRVFDGSSFGSEVNINTFITPKKPLCKAAQGQKATHQWPLKLAVFGDSAENGLPDFELAQNLSENGIMCSYSLDFGDYAVVGTLETLEILD